MNKKKIITFLLITFGISWTIWLPNVLGHQLKPGWQPSDWLHLSGGLGPFLGAIITTFLFDKKQGVKQYLKTKLFILPDTRWLLIGVGMPLVFFLLPFLFLGMVRKDWIDPSQLGLNAKIPFTNPLVIWLTWCLFYGVGEEGGWRGFLFPEITKKFKARISTLYVALIWATWHLPIFFYDKDFMGMGVGGTIGWLVGLIFGSLLLGWLVKQAHGILLPVILWHGTFNFFTSGDKIDDAYPAVMSTLTIIVAVWIAMRYGDDLSRMKRVRAA
jgi:membrane protease YdiL (CAAX protease family)